MDKTQDAHGAIADAADGGIVDSIESKILNIRGKQVMLDRDLAVLYGVETKVLNQAVKRNIERFPERFRFQLTEFETDKLVTNCDRFRNLKHSSTFPYAFTEQGVSMLATVLKSDTAVAISIAIMDAFVALRRFMSANAGLFQRMESLERHQVETDQKIDHVLNCLEEGTLKKFVIVLAVIVAALHNLEIQYNNEYPNKPLVIRKWQKEQHDRWLIIDEELWHCGASLKDAGEKTFGIDPIGLDVRMILSQV